MCVCVCVCVVKIISIFQKYLFRGLSKMAPNQTECSMIEQRSVIKFLPAENCKTLRNLLKNV